MIKDPGDPILDFRGLKLHLFSLEGRLKTKLKLLHTSVQRP